MNIANNILRNALRNVYFLTGTAMGGKTTMAGALSKKYGFIHFNDNWHEESFLTWLSICDAKYQKKSSKRNIMSNEEYFSRTVEEFLSEDDYIGYGEYLEFAIIEIIRLSQHSKVVADLSAPASLLSEISEYNRVACLLASPELVTCAAYGKREDHREFLECLLSLSDSDKKISVQDELFRIDIEKTHKEAREYGLFSVVRTEDSTIEGTLKLIEAHFGLA